MKTISTSYLIFLAGFLAVLIIFTSCGDSSTGPDVDDTGQVDEPIDDDTGDPIDPPPSDNFKIDSDDITETDDGYRFDGILIGVNEDDDEFNIGEGEFNVVLDENGVIISITGVGLPEIPDVGIFKDLLEEFAWNRIEAHIEYKRGSEYLNERDKGIPLNPDRFYISYRVFDESRDGKFELRNKANDFIYDFFDLYIDVDDPALFYRVQVPIPDGDGGNADDAVKSFWKKVSEIAIDKGIDIGENLFEVDNDTYLIFGFSNQGTFTTPEYDLADFGLLDPELFSDFNGYDNLPALPSHLYLKFARFPIPGTKTLINLTGEMSTYSENGNKLIPVDLLTNKVNFSRTESYTGEIFFSAPGLPLILEGILPAINEHTGQDLFGEDFDLAPFEGFLQYQAAVPGINPAFMRFGGSFGNSMLSDIFGPDLQQYLYTPPSLSQKMFGYFNIGPELDDLSFYIESSMKMMIPEYGEVDLNNTIISITAEGIHMYAKDGIEIGPITRTTELEGSIYAGNYNTRAEVINDITLPNNVVLANRELELTSSSDSGATVRGQIILPFNIGEASASGQITDEGITMNGTLSAGSQLALNTGLNLPTRDFEITVSTDPNRILELQGETQIPFVGYNQMTGIINQDQFLFEGEIDRTLTFGSLDVPVGNGSLLIDSNSGVFLDGSYEIPYLGSLSAEGEITNEHIYLAGAVNDNLTFSGVDLPMANGNITLSNSGASLNGTLSLPYNLKTANVSGSISQSAMNLTGSMASSLTYYGVNFPITNSTITASTTSGVTAAFNIRLNERLNAGVTGSISESGYNFTGTNNYVRSITWLGSQAEISGTIRTTLTQNGIRLIGNGRVVGLLGNELWSGVVSITPNWTNRTLQVCTTGTVTACVNI
jgi:hypothetical protein